MVPRTVALLSAISGCLLPEGMVAAISTLEVWATFLVMCWSVGAVGAKTKR